MIIQCFAQNRQHFCRYFSCWRASVSLQAVSPRAQLPRGQHMKHDTVVIPVSSVESENIWQANKATLRKHSAESVWKLGTGGHAGEERCQLSSFCICHLISRLVTSWITGSQVVSCNIIPAAVISRKMRDQPVNTGCWQNQRNEVLLGTTCECQRVEETSTAV